MTNRRAALSKSEEEANAWIEKDVEIKPHTLPRAKQTQHFYIELYELSVSISSIIQQRSFFVNRPNISLWMSANNDFP